MSDSLAPKLKKIEVSTDKLVLDPNNPRFTTRKEDEVKEADILDANAFGKISKRLNNPSYRIEQIESSIKKNGWQPVDFMFVKRHIDNEHFIVLEGNRRLMAISKILDDDSTPKELSDELEKLEVMEIVDDLPPNKLKRKISYLLGVRHHGSLKKWTAFAQAHNIFLRYGEITGETPDKFSWDPSIGKEVADTLSIQLIDVKNRLKVYRAMSQLGEMPDIKDSEGGIEDRYYSLCAEVLLKKNNKLNEYIKQDPYNFNLNEEGMQRFNNLCHFSIEKRKGAPIKNPQEWRAFEKILRETDDKVRAQMLSEVEELKEHPSIVYAKRAAELQKLQWDRWLLKVNSLLKTVTLGDDLTSDDAINVTDRLVKIIERLDTIETDGEAKNA